MGPLGTEEPSGEVRDEQAERRKIQRNVPKVLTEYLDVHGSDCL